jgi:hypothetical protein
MQCILTQRHKANVAGIELLTIREKRYGEASQEYDLPLV